VNSNLYNKDSIESLSPLEFTRLRPRCLCWRYYLFNSIIG